MENNDTLITIFGILFTIKQIAINVLNSSWQGKF